MADGQKDKRRTAKDGMRIVVTEDGPYEVSGSVPMSDQQMVPDADGLSVEWRQGKEYPVEEDYSLCRCGRSTNMPYCDQSHLDADWDGRETASRVPFAARTEPKTVGPQLELSDVVELCASACFCDRAGGVWDLTRASDDPTSRALAIEEVGNCSAGRLVISDKEGNVIEPVFEPSIGLVEDLAAGVKGPLWVRGGIPVEAADGIVYEIRNRVTLCRCGKSDTKPFCNGSHLEPD